MPPDDRWGGCSANWGGSRSSKLAGPAPHRWPVQGITDGSRTRAGRTDILGATHGKRAFEAGCRAAGRRLDDGRVRRVRGGDWPPEQLTNGRAARGPTVGQTKAITQAEADPTANSTPHGTGNAASDPTSDPQGDAPAHAPADTKCDAARCGSSDRRPRFRYNVRRRWRHDHVGPTWHGWATVDLALAGRHGCWRKRPGDGGPSTAETRRSRGPGRIGGRDGCGCSGPSPARTAPVRGRIDHTCRDPGAPLASPLRTGSPPRIGPRQSPKARAPRAAQIPRSGRRDRRAGGRPI